MKNSDCACNMDTLMATRLDLRYRQPFSFSTLILVSIIFALYFFRGSISSVKICIKTVPEQHKTSNSVEDNGGTNTNNIFQSHDKNLTALTMSPAAQKSILRSPDVIKLLHGPLVKTLYEAGFEVPNEDTCPESGASLQFFILVPSTHKNVEKRNAIRQTWGFYATRNDIAMAFLLGQPKNLKDKPNIIAESEMYNDIIINNNVDAYSNLTLKTVSLLEWVFTYCSKTKFILKVDDDTFLNVPRVIDLVASHKNKKRTVFGQIFASYGVIRDPNHKNHIPHEVYPLPTLPAYAIGQGYIITGDFIKDLYERALNTPFEVNEDSFLNGFVLQSLKGNRIDFPAVWKREEKRCNLKRDVWVKTERAHIMFDLWKRLFIVSEKCL